MANKHTRPIESSLLRSKLAKLATTLEQSRTSEDFVTREAYLRESAKMISTFYQNLSKPNFVPEEILSGTLPDMAEYNGMFMAILDDLQILFAELENVEALVLGNFNATVTNTSRLNRRLKEISSKLGDYILYTNNATRDAIFLKTALVTLPSYQSTVLC